MSAASTSPWWQTMFSGLALELQRGMYPPEKTAADVEFLAETLGPAKESGTRVLDVPCGNGRLSIPLAERGYLVTGVDQTAELLEDAKNAAMEKQVAATFLRQDMRELSAEESFDCAFCCGNSFAYFEDEGNRRFLQAVFRALRPSGTFVLETNLAAECMFKVPTGRNWFPFGDINLLHETEYDPIAGQWTSRYIFLRGSEVERKIAHYRIYTCRQILELLAAVGFREVSAYGSPQRERFEIGSPALWVVCRK